MRSLTFPALAAAALASLALAAPARADDPPAGPGSGPSPSPSPAPLLDPPAIFGQGDAVLAAVGVSKIDGDWYLSLRPSLEFTFDKLAIGVHAPMNLLAPYPTPSAAAKANTYGGVLRKTEWPALASDTYGQYLALVHSVRLGHKHDPLYVQYGMLSSATIGHGTIVDRYSNLLDPDHARPGLEVDFDELYGGAEALLDSIAVPGTGLMALRGYVRPMMFGSSRTTDEASRLLVGATVAGDRLALGALGRSEAPVVLGVDVEYRVLRQPKLELVPYLDVNREAAGGEAAWGVHLGARAGFRLGSRGASGLWAKLEYRAMQAGYVPAYFDPAYDLQKEVFPVGALALPKSAALSTLAAAAGPLQHGILAEATVDLAGLLTGGASVSAIPGTPKGTSLLVFTSLTGLEDLKASLYFLRKNFDRVDELWRLDERTVLTGVLMYRLAGPLFASASVHRHWLVKETGGYTGTTDVQFGLQAYVPLDGGQG